MSDKKRKSKDYFVSTKNDITFLPEEEWVDVVLLCDDEKQLKEDLSALKGLVQKKTVRLINAGKADKLGKFAVVLSVLEDKADEIQKVVDGVVRFVQ
jgi:cell division GTPase FtsZ